MKKYKIGFYYFTALFMLTLQGNAPKTPLIESNKSPQLQAFQKNTPKTNPFLKLATTTNKIIQTVPPIPTLPNKMHANFAARFSPQNLQITPKQNNEAVYSSLRTLAEVIDLIERESYRTIDFKKFIEEGLKAAVPSVVEPHSAFFTQESYTKTIEATSSEFSGVGISVISKDITDDWIVVTDVIDEGPCDKAGLKPGDKIIDIDGEKLKGLSSDEVINKLKGPINTKVKIKIIRNNKPLDKIFVITREMIKNEVASGYLFKDYNIYYISLRLFSENATENTAKYLKKATDAKCKGIILDLRRNPGGILDVVINMAGLFLKKDSLVVSTKDRTQKVVDQYKTTHNASFKSDIPIFILTDNFTASASEILAGDLRYYSDLYTRNNKSKNPNEADPHLMVFLIGTTTFGKGSVQKVIPISNGCALKLTTMLYYLPDESTIQASGIKPDFTIKPKITPEEEVKWVTEFYGTESSLKNHITLEEAKGEKVENKNSNKKEEKQPDEEPSWEERHQKALHQDMQIRTAVNMINLFALAKQAAPEAVATRSGAVKFLKNNFASDDEITIEKVKD